MEFFRISRDIPFMRHALVFNIISLVTFVAAVIFLAVNGLNLGVDFRGGTVIEVTYGHPVDFNRVRSAIDKLNLGEFAAQSFGSSDPYEREFRGIQKFMPISRSHPSLVHILHVGRNDAAGLIYYVMEAADDEATGQSINPETYSPLNLSRSIRKHGHLEASECLRLALPLAASLGYLHSRNLIHRDIKPANIIFVAGEPKLADIGLVTEFGRPGLEPSFVGTEGYIPPEGPGQPSADVYALGMVLYEALMGLPRDGFPALPEDALQRTDAELLLALNDLILKACAPDFAERYLNGTEFHHALARLKDLTKV